jgi:hypothetical protein
MLAGTMDIAAYALVADSAGYVAVVPSIQFAVALAGTSDGSGCTGEAKR